MLWTQHFRKIDWGKLGDSALLKKKNNKKKKQGCYLDTEQNSAAQNFNFQFIYIFLV